MAATERLANLGYLALKKEATAGTAVTPNVFVPMYKETMVTDTRLDADIPIMGNKSAVYQFVQGQRQHKGTIEFQGDGNVIGYFLDAMLNRTGTTGAGPYTHSFALNSTTPNSYTIEFLKGASVFRYFGVQVSQLTPSFVNNEMHMTATVSARGQFSFAEVSATPTGTNPYTIVFKTLYDPNPTNGLVVGDVMTYFKSDGTTISFTIASITNGTTITTTTDVTSGAAGDLISLRALSPSYTLLAMPFVFSTTEFRFGATASAALSATHTPVEPGSLWTLTHAFLPDGGALRSGTLDPAALPRGLGDATAKVKHFFDDGGDYNRFLAVQKRALVIRHFGPTVSATVTELRITLNNIKAIGSPTNEDTGTIIYSDIDYRAQFDTSDTQSYDVKLINSVSTY